MPSRKRLLSRVSCLAALLASAPSSRAVEPSPRPIDKPEEFYPLAIGHRWTYKVAGKDDRVVVDVPLAEKVGDTVCFRLEERVKDRLVGVEFVNIFKEGVFRFRYGDTVLKPPFCLCRFPIKKGDAWGADSKIGTGVLKGKLTLDLEDVTVPAGSYKDAVAVSGEFDDPAGKATTKLWLVRNVGVVKKSFASGDKKGTLELEKFEALKK